MRRHRQQDRIGARAVATIARALALWLTVAGVSHASEVADYRVTFDATWSAATHPTAYPTDAHFSPLVGGTHDATTHLYEVGGIATTGIERMAETGATPDLLAEVAAEMLAGNAFSQVLGFGIDSPGSTSTVFRVFSEQPFATVVSMIAPSPDWFVGVDGLELHDGTDWLDDVVVSLAPYDAGSDDGVDFDSANANTNPPEPIAGFAGAPFAGTPDLGTFTFEFIGIVAACSDGVDNDGDGRVDFGDDPDCTSGSDTSEAAQPVGAPGLQPVAALGLFGALLVTGLRAVRR